MTTVSGNASDDLSPSGRRSVSGLVGQGRTSWREALDGSAAAMLLVAGLGIVAATARHLRSRHVR